MPESERPANPSPDKANPSSPATDGAAFTLAEDLLAAGNETSAQQGKDAVLAAEYRKADGPEKPTELSAFRDKKPDAKDAADKATNDKVEAALEEKAIEEGVATANDTARIVTDLTAPNM